jgi:hypothetical protein
MTKKIKITMILVAVVLASLFITGCASIISGGSQTISISSNVHGAFLALNGAPIGTTPFVGNVSRGSNRTVVVTHPDHHPETITLTARINTVFLLNIISGGVLGTTTDLATGAIWQFSPTSFFVNLRPIVQSQFDFERESRIRYFAMMNHSQIAIDSYSENGEFLLTLAYLMSDNMTQDHAIQSIQEALTVSKGNQVVFGEELINSFRTSN